MRSLQKDELISRCAVFQHSANIHTWKVPGQEHSVAHAAHGVGRRPSPAPEPLAQHRHQLLSGPLRARFDPHTRGSHMQQSAAGSAGTRNSHLQRHVSFHECKHQAQHVVRKREQPCARLPRGAALSAMVARHCQTKRRARPPHCAQTANVGHLRVSPPGKRLLPSGRRIVRRRPGTNGSRPHAATLLAPARKPVFLVQVGPVPRDGANSWGRW